MTTVSPLLRNSGYTVRSASTGRAALDIIERDKPDLIVLDLGLPDLDGGEVATRLRRTPGCENAVIIALTGLGDEERPRMLQSGCDAFYTKPLEINLIEGLLKR